MGPIFTLAIKDLRLLVKDRAGFFFVLIFPVLAAIFFGSMYAGQADDGERPRLKLLYLDEDQTDASWELVASLTADPHLNVEPAVDRDAGLAKVRGGGATALVVITPGFGAAMSRPFWGEPSVLEVAVDPSRAAEQGLLQGLLMERAYRQFQSLFTDPDRWRAMIETSLGDLRGSNDPMARLVMPFLGSLEVFLEGWNRERSTAPADGSESASVDAWQPVRIDELSVTSEDSRHPQVSGYAISFPQGAMWGIIGCAAAFGISIVVERTRGTLERLRLAPLGRAQILGGKALACFLATMSVAIFLFVIGWLLFGVQPNSIPRLAVGLLSIAICFVGIMMLLSIIGKTEAAAAGIGWSVLLVCSMFGGGMMPLFILPRWVQDVGSFSPVKWGILVMEGAVWRDFGWARMLECCGILVAYGIVTFVVGVILARRWNRL